MQVLTLECCSVFMKKRSCCTKNTHKKQSIIHCKEWDNVRIRTPVWIYGKIWPPSSRFPSDLGHSLPCIPPHFLIWIKYAFKSNFERTFCTLFLGFSSYQEYFITGDQVLSILSIAKSVFSYSYIQVICLQYI